MEEKALNEFHAGVDGRLLTGDEANITQTGNVMRSLIHSLNLKDSPDLSRDFVIKGGKSVRIWPGDKYDFRWHRLKPRTLRYDEVSDDDTLKSIRGLTVVPVFKIQMMVGRDTGDPEEIALMSGTASLRVMKRHTWKKTTSHLSLLGIGNTMNAAFTNGGEGPTDEVDQADL
jgi:hypothetical protein